MTKTFEFHVPHGLARRSPRPHGEAHLGLESPRVAATWTADEANLDGKVMGMHLVP
jgi:hypothetical protein